MIETRAAIVYQVLAKAIYLRPYSAKHSSKGRYYGHNLYDPGELILMYSTRQIINAHLFVTADFISRTRQQAALCCAISRVSTEALFSTTEHILRAMFNLSCMWSFSIYLCIRCLNKRQNVTHFAWN